MASPKPQLTYADYLTLPIPLAKTLFAVSKASVTGLFRGSWGPPTYAQHVLFTLLRTFLEVTPVRLMQGITPNTKEAYEAFAKEKGFKPQGPINILNRGTTEPEVEGPEYGFWLGNPDAKNVLVWCHGGGFVMAAGDIHMKLLWHLMETVNDKGGDMSVFVLHYSLVPHTTYPGQLSEAAEVMTYLFNEKGLKPSQIILGGDSAGGNLALALLSHFLHPYHDGNIPWIHLPEPLRGTIVLSPWICFDPSAKSYQTNLYKDLVNGDALGPWGANYLNGKPADEYNQPITASADWWKGLDRVSSSVAVVSGKNETIVDDISKLVKTMKVNNPTLEYLEAPDECHNFPLFSLLLGQEKDATSLIFVRKWLLERLNL